MIKVSIVDDQRRHSIGLENMITKTEGLELDGQFGDSQEAIVLIPLNETRRGTDRHALGNGESGIDCIRKLKPDYPEILFMICTVYDDDEKIFEALCAGANGLHAKKNFGIGIVRAIREMYEGGCAHERIDCP